MSRNNNEDVCDDSYEYGGYYDDDNGHVDYGNEYGEFEDSEDYEDQCEEKNYEYIVFLRENLKSIFEYSDQYGFPFFQKSRFLSEFNFIKLIYDSTIFPDSLNSSNSVEDGSDDSDGLDRFDGFIESKE